MRWDVIYENRMQHFHLFWHHKIFFLYRPIQSLEENSQLSLKGHRQEWHGGRGCHLLLFCLLETGNRCRIPNPSSSKEKGGFPTNHRESHCFLISGIYLAPALRFHKHMCIAQFLTLGYCIYYSSLSPQPGCPHADDELVGFTSPRTHSR